MSLSDSQPARKFRSLGGQISQASFWTLLIANLVSHLYYCAGYLDAFHALPLGNEFYMRWEHPLLAAAGIVTAICMMPLAILSAMMMEVYKPWGFAGLFVCALDFLYLCIPQFSSSP